MSSKYGIVIEMNGTFNRLNTNDDVCVVLLSSSNHLKLTRPPDFMIVPLPFSNMQIGNTFSDKYSRNATELDHKQDTLIHCKCMRHYILMVESCIVFIWFGNWMLNIYGIAGHTMPHCNYIRTRTFPFTWAQWTCNSIHF